MTTGQFEVDTCCLRRSAAELRQHLQTLKSAQRGLADKMAEVGGMWEGPAKEAFFLQFQADSEQFADLCGRLEEALDCWDNAGKEYDACDDRVRSLIAAIKV